MYRDDPDYRPPPRRWRYSWKTLRDGKPVACEEVLVGPPTFREADLAGAAYAETIGAPLMAGAYGYAEQIPPDDLSGLPRIRTQWKTYGQVHKELCATLDEWGLLPGEYFSLLNDWGPGAEASLTDVPWGAKSARDRACSYRWIAVFVVRGDSEGHYVHVDLLRQDAGKEERQPVYLGKTLREGRAGWDELSRIAGAIGWMLDA